MYKNKKVADAGRIDSYFRNEYKIKETEYITSKKHRNKILNFFWTFHVYVPQTLFFIIFQFYHDILIFMFLSYLRLFASQDEDSYQDCNHTWKNNS